jgi:hypothetical protein
MIDIDKLKEALKEIWNGMANRQGFVKEFKLIETALSDLERLQIKEEVKELLNNGHWESTDAAGNTYAEGHPYYEEEMKEFRDDYTCPICGYHFGSPIGLWDKYCKMCGTKIKIGGTRQ